MKRLFLLLISAGCLSLAAQQDIYTDFDNYSFHPGLADPDNVLEADLFYLSDFTRFDGSPVRISGQVNYWFAGRHNAGLSFEHVRIGPDKRYNVNGSYAYRFSINELHIQPVVQASVAHYITNISAFTPPLNRLVYANLFSASLGVGVHHRKFSGGIFLPYLMQWSGQDVHQLNPAVRVHLEREFAIGNTLEAKPFLRAALRSWYVGGGRLTGGLSARYGNRLELIGAYAIHGIGNTLRFGAGVNLMSGMWLRYQYELAMYEFVYNSRPSHILALSFDLRASGE